MKQAVALPLIGALLLLLLACGTPGRSYVKSEMAETLEIDIRPDTSKMFTYRLRWPEDQVPNHIRIERGGAPSQAFEKGGVDIGKGTHERLLENTAYVVEHAGYCRDGFFELDRSISRYHLWVRGECKDGATEADRQAFGTTQTLTPERWLKRK